MKLNHVATVCRSEENADRFFQDILGLEKTKSARLPKNLVLQIFNLDFECQMIAYTAEAFGVEVFVTDALEVKACPMAHLCLEVKDRPALLADCRAAGLPVKRIPKGDSFLVFIEDFDGNLYEIKKAAA